MASRYYCSNVSGELEYWSRRLHKLSSEIDGIASIDKYKLQPQIDELHIIMTELDDRLCDLVTACDSAESFDSLEGKRPEGSRMEERLSSNELFDYDFGC
jgi:hypothetical protein